MRRFALITLAAAGCALFESSVLVAVPAGTWGGDNAGLIVTDTGSHAHIGCTMGLLPDTIPLDAEGRFDVAGSHNITAHPVNLGIFHPARFAGRVDLTFRALTLTVTVTDTLNHETVVLGPVRLRLGVRPEMGPCPICSTLPD